MLKILMFVVFGLAMISSAENCSAALEQSDFSMKEKILDLTVTLPPVFGKSIKGEILLEHAENAARVPSSTEVYEVILNFIYAENGTEKDHFNPANGQAVFIPKENLNGILDTDLLKAKFYPPVFDVAHLRDVYPVDFKFRASFLQHIFMKTFITATHVNGDVKWKVFYLDQFEIDGIEIQINAMGAVTKMNLSKAGKLVKALKMQDLPSITQAEF